MYKILSLMIFLVLIGCDNTIINNSGALPNIDFKGSIWAGNVRYAKVQFVGVDQYGQPQRQSDGSFFGDEHYTDDLGQFSASIQGAYSGSLIGVASYADYEITVSAATDTQAAVTETRKTQFRCVLPAGCKNEALDNVIYGDWYNAPANFEMWGALSSIAGLEQFNITPITHLAAKQAFSLLVSNGLSCDANDVNSCVGEVLENNLFTPDTIYEGNHKVKQFFLLNTGLHVNTTPWYEGVVSIDASDEIELAKHGLISMAFQKFSRDRLETFMTTLAWWESSFLKHDGNLYIDGTVDAPADLDATQLFQTTSSVEAEYDAASKSNSALTSAKSTFISHLDDITSSSANSADLLPFVAVVYNDGLADKIIAAQALVSKVQTWALDMGLHQYESFFDAEVAQEITKVEAEWADYNQKIGPVMKSFFKPIIKTAEYALTCIPTGVCDSSHDLNALNGTLLNYTASTKTMTLINEASGSLTLDGKVYGYSRIRLVGIFDDILGQSDSYKIFSFSEVYLETTEGVVELAVSDGVMPSVAFWLGESLAEGVDPIVVRIDVDVPSLTLQSKTTVEHQFNSTVFNATLIGVRDPVSLISDPDTEYHYNILSANIEGQFSGVGEQGDALDLRFTLNSENATTFYSSTRFPDLEMNIDSTAFKNYTKLTGEASDFISNQGGWFTLPANLSLADITDGSRQELSGPSGVKFFDRGLFSSWDPSYDLLKELLSLSNSSSAKLGTLSYPGGETALVIFKADSTDDSELARQCNRVGVVWGCQAALPVSSLGCGDEFSSATATVIEAFNWLRSEECIAQVRIDGRGIYDIGYPNLTDSFVDEEEFNITINTPEYLGIENFYVSLISRFVDGANEPRPTALMILNGAAPDMENVTMGFSLTHDYIGGSSSSAIGIDSLIPYGDNSIWLAVGQSSSEQDALVYYIQDANITMTVFGFDYSDSNSTANPSHDDLLASIRYDGQLLGSLRKEGDLYVIRYIDGTWQLL